MTPKEINTEITKSGFDQTAIAHALECSPSLISKVINRSAVSLRVARAIALTIDKPLLDVFPEYEHGIKPKFSRKQQVDELRQRFSEL